jgi:hypothetical protein
MAFIQACRYPQLIRHNANGAYDKSDWGYLQAWMKAMGFKETSHVCWATIIHQGGTAAVKIKHYLSCTFPIVSGLLRGSSG